MLFFKVLIATITSMALTQRQNEAPTADYIDCRLDLDTGVTHCKYTSSDDVTNLSYGDEQTNTAYIILIGKDAAYDFLCQKSILYPGTGLISANGDNALVLQYDGNLCAYDYAGMKGDDPNGRVHPIWTPNWCALPAKLSYRFLPGYLKIGNGTLSLYTGNPTSHLYWLVGMPGRGPNYLKLHNDGNLCLYEIHGVSVWCSLNYTYHDSQSGLRRAYSSCFNQSRESIGFHPILPVAHAPATAQITTTRGATFDNLTSHTKSTSPQTSDYDFAVVVVLFGSALIGIACVSFFYSKICRERYGYTTTSLVLDARGDSESNNGNARAKLCEAQAIELNGPNASYYQYQRHS